MTFGDGSRTREEEDLEEDGGRERSEGGEWVRVLIGSLKCGLERFSWF